MAPAADGARGKWNEPKSAQPLSQGEALNKEASAPKSGSARLLTRRPSSTSGARSYAEMYAAQAKAAPCSGAPPAAAVKGAASCCPQPPREQQGGCDCGDGGGGGGAPRAPSPRKGPSRALRSTVAPGARAHGGGSVPPGPQGGGGQQQDVGSLAVVGQAAAMNARPGREWQVKGQRAPRQHNHQQHYQQQGYPSGGPEGQQSGEWQRQATDYATGQAQAGWEAYQQAGGWGGAAWPANAQAMPDHQRQQQQQSPSPHAGRGSGGGGSGGGGSSVGGEKVSYGGAAEAMMQAWSQEQVLAAYVQHMQQQLHESGGGAVPAPYIIGGGGGGASYGGAAGSYGGAAGPSYGGAAPAGASPYGLFRGASGGSGGGMLDWGALARQASAALGSPGRFADLTQMLPQPRFQPLPRQRSVAGGATEHSSPLARGRSSVHQQQGPWRQGSAFGSAGGGPGSPLRHQSSGGGGGSNGQQQQCGAHGGVPVAGPDADMARALYEQLCNPFASYWANAPGGREAAAAGGLSRGVSDAHRLPAGPLMKASSMAGGSQAPRGPSWLGSGGGGSSGGGVGPLPAATAAGPEGQQLHPPQAVVWQAIMAAAAAAGGQPIIAGVPPGRGRSWGVAALSPQDSGGSPLAHNRAGSGPGGRLSRRGSGAPGSSGGGSWEGSQHSGPLRRSVLGSKRWSQPALGPGGGSVPTDWESDPSSPHRSSTGGGLGSGTRRGSSPGLLLRTASSPVAAPVAIKPHGAHHAPSRLGAGGGPVASAGLHHPHPHPHQHHQQQQAAAPVAAHHAGGHSVLQQGGADGGPWVAPGAWMSGVPSLRRAATAAAAMVAAAAAASAASSNPASPTGRASGGGRGAGGRGLSRGPSSGGGNSRNGSSSGGGGAAVSRDSSGSGGAATATAQGGFQARSPCPPDSPPPAERASLRCTRARRRWGQQQQEGAAPGGSSSEWPPQRQGSRGYAGKQVADCAAAPNAQGSWPALRVKTGSGPLQHSGQQQPQGGAAPAGVVYARIGGSQESAGPATEATSDGLSPFTRAWHAARPRWAGGSGGGAELSGGGSMGQRGGVRWGSQPGVSSSGGGGAAAATGGNSYGGKGPSSGGAGARGRNAGGGAAVAAGSSVPVLPPIRP